MKRLSIILLLLSILYSCNNIDSYKQKAKDYLFKEDFTEAIRYADKVVHKQPDSYEGYFVKYLAYMGLGDNENALLNIDKVIELNAKIGKINILLYFDRSIIKMETGMLQEALEDLNFVIEKNDTLIEKSELFINKGTLLYMLGDKKGASHWYDLAKKYNLKNNKQFESNILVGKANIEIDYKKYKNALFLLNKAINVDSSNYLSYGARGVLFLELEIIDKAYKDLEKAILINPNDSKSLTNLALLQVYYTQEFNKSIANYTRSLKLSPHNSTNYISYLNMAIAKDKIGDNIGAFEDIEKSLSLNSTDPIIFFNYAMFLSNASKNQEALDKINAAIKLDGKDAELYNLKGSILMDLNAFNEAESFLKKAIELDKDYGAPYYNLGHFYSEKEDFNKSLKFYNKAIDLKFNLPSSLVNRALIKIKMNMYSGACKDLKLAKNIGRNDIEPLINKYCN